VLVQSYSDEEELPKFSSDIVPKEEEKTTKDKPKILKEREKKSEGKLLDRLNELGLSLKPNAQQVNLKAASATKRKSQIALKLKACLYWTLYMGYRGYRGFFVILPAVFREVYKKMETAVDFRVLDDEQDKTLDTAGDVNPATGKVRWRTKITVSVLAGIVTLTYVVGGLARVLMKFVKTMLSSSSLSGSFSAAADEVEGNEGRLMRLSGKEDDDDKGTNNNINGSASRKDLGF